MIDFGDEEVQKLAIGAFIVLGSVMICGVLIYCGAHTIWSALQ